MENENLEKNIENNDVPKKKGKKTLIIIIIIILFAILSIFGYIYFSRTYKQDQNNNKPEIKDEEKENNKVENNEDNEEDSDEKEDIPNNNEEDDSSVENDDLKLYFRCDYDGCDPYDRYGEYYNYKYTNTYSCISNSKKECHLNDRVTYHLNNIDFNYSDAEVIVDNRTIFLYNVAEQRKIMDLYKCQTNNCELINYYEAKNKIIVYDEKTYIYDLNTKESIQINLNYNEYSKISNGDGHNDTIGSILFTDNDNVLIFSPNMGYIQLPTLYYYIVSTKQKFNENFYTSISIIECNNQQYINAQRIKWVNVESCTHIIDVNNGKILKTSDGNFFPEVDACKLFEN